MSGILVNFDYGKPNLSLVGPLDAGTRCDQVVDATVSEIEPQLPIILFPVLKKKDDQNVLYLERYGFRAKIETKPFVG